MNLVYTIPFWIFVISSCYVALWWIVSANELKVLLQFKDGLLLAIILWSFHIASVWSFVWMLKI